MLPGLGLASVLVIAPPSSPAEAEAEAKSYQRLEARTGLDLTRIWADYPHDRRADETFYNFTRRRFRRRLGAGIGLSVAGLGLTVAGIAMVLVSASKDTDAAEIDIIGGALVVTLGIGLAVPGAILWPVNQVRLHKLRRAGPLADVQLRAVGPIALRRGAGLGLALSF